MPEDIQVSLYRSVPGLENAELIKPAYGVEYDHVDARELGREYPNSLLYLNIIFICRIKLLWKPSA